MQDKSKGNKNLMEIVDEHMKEDVVVRYRNVFDDHNSDGFKKMNKEFEKTVHTYWNDDRDLGYLKD